MPKRSAPSFCPACGSDRVRVVDSRFMNSDARGRQRVCEDCQQVFTSVVLTETIGDALVTVEMVAPRLASSALVLRKLLEKFRAQK